MALPPDTLRIQVWKTFPISLFSGDGMCPPSILFDREGFGQGQYNLSRLVTPLVATPWLVQGSSQWSKERSENLGNEFVEGCQLVFLLLSTGDYLMPVVLTSRLDPRNRNWRIPYTIQHPEYQLMFSGQWETYKRTLQHWYCKNWIQSFQHCTL